MVATFIVSLLVAIITCLMTYVLTEGYVSQYEKTVIEPLLVSARGEPRRAVADERPAARRELDAQVVLSYNQSPDVVRSWFAQGLDIATNFPTALLTVVAYSDLFPNRAEPYFYLVAGVSLTIAFIAAGRPSVAAKYYRANYRKFRIVSFRFISVLSVVLIVLNGIGLAIVLNM